MTHERSRGFVMLEVLVATAILIVGVASLAQLFVMSTHTNRVAATASANVTLAAEKMEELLTGTSLAPSPPGALSADTAGSVDYPDSRVRRWSIEASPGSASGAMVLQVLVMPALTSRNGSRAPGATHLVALKTRRTR